MSVTPALTAHAINSSILSYLFYFGEEGKGVPEEALTLHMLVLAL
jgi:hypothetical protein